MNTLEKLMSILLFVVVTMGLVLTVSTVNVFSEASSEEVVSRYSNAILVGPPTEVEGSPTVKLVDRVDVYRSYIRTYNYDGTEGTYSLETWDVYTSALPLTSKMCPDGAVSGYVIPKGESATPYTRLRDARMCIEHVADRWIASREYYDITNGDRMYFSESFSPDAVEIYAADFNGIYSIVDHEVKLELN